MKKSVILMTLLSMLLLSSCGPINSGWGWNNTSSSNSNNAVQEEYVPEIETNNVSQDALNDASSDNDEILNLLLAE